MSEQSSEMGSEDFYNYNLIELQNENESLKIKVQNLELTIQTYQDENAKFTIEKEELLKQIKHIREKSEEAESQIFRDILKSETILNLKQELTDLNEQNANYKKRITEITHNLQQSQLEIEQLKQENLKYVQSLNESRANQDIITQNYVSQTTELLELQHNLEEYQSKYERLEIENSCFQQENEELCHTVALQTESNHDHNITPRKDKKYFRYQRTMRQSKMEEVMDQLQVTDILALTPRGHSNKHHHHLTIINNPVTPKSTKTPKKLSLYNFESSEYISLASPNGHQQNVPRFVKVRSNGVNEELTALSPTTMKEYQTMDSQDDDGFDGDLETYYQDLMDKQRVEMMEEREQMEKEWHQKLDKLQNENKRLQRSYRKLSVNKKKDKLSKIKLLERKVKALETMHKNKVVTDTENNFWGIPCILKWSL